MRFFVRRFTWFVAVVVACSFLFDGRVSAQTDGFVNNSNLRGVVPFGTYQFGDIDSVNLATGGLDLRIPLVSRKGRGMDTGLAFVYSSKRWILSPIYNPTKGVYDSLQWTLSTENQSPRVVATEGGLLDFTWKQYTCRYQVGTQLQSFGVTILSNFVYVYPDGSKAQFPNRSVYKEVNRPLSICISANGQPPSDDSVTTLGYSDSGSMQLDTSSNPYVISFKDGRKQQVTLNAQHLSSGGPITDSNGNQFSIGDTLGRTGFSDSNGNALTYSTTGGVNRIGPATTFPTTGGPRIANCIYQYPAGGVSGPETLTLPNGQTYTLSFDTNFGEVTKIILPTGGYIKYVYGTLPGLDNGPDANFNTCSMGPYDSRRVVERHVSADGVTESVWKYSYTRNGGTVTTTVTDPLNNVSIHTFSNASSSSPGLETERDIYDNAGHLLRKTANVWDGAMGPTQRNQDGTCTSTVRNFRITSSTMTLVDTNQVLLNETVFDTSNTYTANICLFTTVTESRMNVLETHEYDYGNGAPGPLLRKSVFTYLHDSKPQYLTSYILNRVSSKTVYDSASNTCKGLNQPCAQTTYLFDSTTPIANTSGTGQAVSHDYGNFPSSFTTRGNLTETDVWRNTDGALLATKNWYDDLGHVVQTQDPLLYNTFFDFTDSWSTQTGGNTCAPASGTARAFLTKVTNHLGQIHSFSNYSCSSLHASITDPNSNTVSLTYDLLDRAIEADFPDGGQTKKCFTNTPGSSCYSAQLPLKEITSYKINSLTTFTSTVVGDGLGRFVQSQLNSASPVIYTDTVYDELGRTKTVSNPYSSTSDPTYGITTFNYDALGRVSKVIPPDGTSSTNNTTTVYTGNCTTVTDQAGKSRKSCSDGLGRLTQVVEDPAGSGFESDYGYDALNNLLTVSQKGGSTNSANWRPRSFTYNSLSQLVCASNPENSSAACPATSTGAYVTGTTGYTYDANGNLSTKTSPAPNQTGSATVTATYAYDALNRMTQKTFSDGSPGMYYWYDVHPTWGGTDVTNVVGRLVEAKNQFAGIAGSGTSTLYSYDAMGRVVRESQQTPLRAPAGQFLFATYDLAGNVASYTNGLGSTTFTQTFDGAGRLSQLTSNLNDAQHPGTLFTADSSVGYFPNGALRKAVLGNGLTLTNMYNNRLQPCRIDVNSSNTTTLQTCTDGTPTGNVIDFSYGYGTSNNGNVMQWNAVGGQTFNRSYSYDSINRLASLGDTASAQPCKGLSWTYDAWGNRTDQTVTAGTCNTFHASVGSNNRLSGAPYQYDAAGNMIHDASHSYMYDAENHLIAVDGTAATYVYDARGRRVEKKIGTNITDYLYDFSGNVVTEGTAGCGSLCATNQYAYANGSLVAQYENNTTYFIHKDQLGTTRLLTKMDKSIFDNMDFLPFGEQIAGTSSTSHKFTSKERDSESSLDNFGARHDSSDLGRFMSPDTGTFHFENPQSLNRYSYVLNDPLRFIDPDGRDPIDPNLNWALTHLDAYTLRATNDLIAAHRAGQTMMMSSDLAGLLSNAAVRYPTTCRNCGPVSAEAFSELFNAVENQSIQTLLTKVDQFVSDPKTSAVDLMKAYSDLDEALEGDRKEMDKLNKAGGRVGLLNPIYGFYAWMLSELPNPQQALLEQAKEKLREAIRKKIEEGEKKKTETPRPVSNEEGNPDTN